MILTRTRADGVVHVVEVPNLRDARKHVAWCMTDNANTTRLEASRISDALVVGEALAAHGYAFELALSS
jgi:hypothetical protein